MISSCQVQPENQSQALQDDQQAQGLSSSLPFPGEGEASSFQLSDGLYQNPVYGYGEASSSSSNDAYQLLPTSTTRVEPGPHLGGVRDNPAYIRGPPSATMPPFISPQTAASDGLMPNPVYDRSLTSDSSGATLRPDRPVSTIRGVAAGRAHRAHGRTYFLQDNPAYESLAGGSQS